MDKQIDLRKLIKEVLDTAITVDSSCNVIPKEDQILTLISQWGNETCLHFRSGNLFRRECPLCWDELEKELVNEKAKQLN